MYVTNTLLEQVELKNIFFHQDVATWSRKLSMIKHKLRRIINQINYSNAFNDPSNNDSA